MRSRRTARARRRHGGLRHLALHQARTRARHPGADRAVDHVNGLEQAEVYYGDQNYHVTGWAGALDRGAVSEVGDPSQRRSPVSLSARAHPRHGARRARAAETVGLQQRCGGCHRHGKPGDDRLLRRGRHEGRPHGADRLDVGRCLGRPAEIDAVDPRTAVRRARLRSVAPADPHRAATGFPLRHRRPSAVRFQDL